MSEPGQTGIEGETLRVLEYDRIRRLLAGFSVTTLGRERALDLEPLRGREAVAAALADAAEMMAALELQGAPPVAGAQDLGAILGRLRAEGLRLDPEELLAVLGSIEAAGACRGFFDGERSPRLAGLAGGLAPLTGLGREIRAAVGQRGEILDGASADLAALREELRELRGRIRRSLEELLGSEGLAGIFQDRIVTERGGRYVVPVKADHRGRLPGFVHDESASGQTLFVEPAATLEQNNRLQSLLRAEQREVERILQRLSAAVRSVATPLLANQELLARIDFLGAAARFGRASGASIPRLAGEPLLELREARHPLLLLEADGRPRAAEVVPVELRLGEGFDTLIVSGPNTGGKTVALKTAGLLVLMVNSGLPVPCHPDSRVGPFRRVCADVGDEQSIERSLSTFSGHLLRIGRILEAAGPDALVLLDELGTGTDPGEGGALALALLDRLREKGARSIVTTHLNQVKGYAFVNEGVESAAVEFDPETLEPRYRLHYGIPGASSAFTIARRLGLPESLLERAEAYLGRGEGEGMELLEELNGLRRRLEGELEEAESLRAEAERDRQSRREALEGLRSGRREILQRAADRAERRVGAAEARLQGLLREAEAAAGPRERSRIQTSVREVRREAAALRPAPAPRGRRPRAPEAGELLWVPALGAEGEVVRAQGGEVELDVGGKKLRLPVERLEQYQPRRFARSPSARPRTRVSGRVEREGFSPRLVLVGRRVEEALVELDRFLDDALLQGAREVEVVHGSGTGALRRAVREFLAGHRGVAEFRAGEPERGGENLTAVELKTR